MVVVVVFEIAWMRLIRLGSGDGRKRGSRGNRVLSGVDANGLRERASAEVRWTETAAVRKSAAAQCPVPADSAAMAAASPTPSMRTATRCGTGATAPAGCRRACRNGPARCPERDDDDDE
jgi:hypothetical protein